MTRRKFIAAVFVWTFATIFGMGMFFFVTPTVEIFFAPILSNQRISNIVRESGKVCWTWSWIKQRYAQPTLVAWSIVVTDTNVEVPVVVSRKVDNVVLRDPKTHTLGHGSNDFCAAIPPALEHIPALEIRGQANYALSHGLWTIWQPIPTVFVP